MVFWNLLPLMIRDRTKAARAHKHELRARFVVRLGTALKETGQGKMRDRSSPRTGHPRLPSEIHLPRPVHRYVTETLPDGTIAIGTSISLVDTPHSRLRKAAHRSGSSY